MPQHRLRCGTLCRTLRTCACEETEGEQEGREESSHVDDYHPLTNATRSKSWWAHQDLNLEPTDYESAALTN
jgi:hypothetical protein